MARRLAGAGHRLIVSDTDPAARQRAGDVAGVEVAPGAGAAVAGVGEVVITSLPDPAEAEAVYGGIARAGLGEGEVAAVARVVEGRARACRCEGGGRAERCASGRWRSGRGTGSCRCS